MPRSASLSVAGGALGTPSQTAADARLNLGPGFCPDAGLGVLRTLACLGAAEPSRRPEDAPPRHPKLPKQQRTKEIRVKTGSFRLFPSR